MLAGKPWVVLVVEPHCERNVCAPLAIFGVTENTSGEQLGGHWLVLRWRGLQEWCLPHTSLKVCLHKSAASHTSPMPCFLILSSFDIPNQPPQVSLSIYITVTKQNKTKNLNTGYLRGTELYFSLDLEAVRFKSKALSGCSMRTMLSFQNGMKKNDGS